ncbi:hypothetical protein LBMAG42_05540 [Deltaproteobacteria bacterium]|nr:hypothetical protein LBMAG42_05540 [Deltaproteobacteria bacterium]
MEYPEIAALRAVDALAAMRLAAAIRNLEEQLAATGWAARQLPSLFASDNETERLDRVVALAQEACPDAEVWAVRWSGDFVAGTASFQALAGAKREIPPPGVISRSLVGRAIASGKPLWMDDPTRRAPESAASIVVSLVGWVGCAPLGNNGVLYLSGPPGTRVPSAAIRARVDTLAQLAAAILDAAAVAPAAGAATPGRRPSASTELPGIVGSSSPMRELARTVRAFAPMPWPALVRGETGTGKEAVARAFHALSARKDGPFIAVNCATIPEELAESMIFGHEKGAFTGADRARVGLAEESAGGTLFLDEIGELPARVQPKLLRLLQEGTFTRVGSSKELQFTGRIVGATLRPLEDANSFRGDLYHRLAACVVHTPPLRARREDIPDLARHLLAKAAKQAGCGGVELEEDAVAVLARREWPGNVRELENVLRSGLARAVATGARTVGLEHLDAAAPASAGQARGAEPVDVGSGGLLEATERFQRRMLRDSLAANGGNVTRAAESLGVSKQWLHRLISRWGGAP